MSARPPETSLPSCPTQLSLPGSGWGTMGPVLQEGKLSLKRKGWGGAEPGALAGWAALRVLGHCRVVARCPGWHCPPIGAAGEGGTRVLGPRVPSWPGPLALISPAGHAPGHPGGLRECQARPFLEIGAAAPLAQAWGGEVSSLTALGRGGPLGLFVCVLWVYRARI